MSRGIEFALNAMMLILPLSALLARRISVSQTLKMATAWIAIFAVGLAVVGQRDRLLPLWDGTRDALFGRDQHVVGNAVRISMAPDGHFWAAVSINGLSRRTLIDTGATTTALFAAIASAAKVKVGDSHFAEAVETANGPVLAKRATIARIDLEGITAFDLAAVVAPEFGDTDVAGMNFLSQLKSWRVEGRSLILTPDERR